MTKANYKTYLDLMAEFVDQVFHPDSYEKYCYLTDIWSCELLTYHFSDEETCQKYRDEFEQMRKKVREIADKVRDDVDECPETYELIVNEVKLRDSIVKFIDHVVENGDAQGAWRIWAKKHVMFDYIKRSLTNYLDLEKTGAMEKQSRCILERFKQIECKGVVRKLV